MNADPLPRPPAAFTVTDEELTFMAQSALAWNFQLPVNAVKASAVSGWLTLSGELMWECQRQDAEECVRYLPGLAGLTNDITLRPASTRVQAAP